MARTPNQMVGVRPVVLTDGQENITNTIGTDGSLLAVDEVWRAVQDGRHYTYSDYRTGLGTTAYLYRIETGSVETALDVEFNFQGLATVFLYGGVTATGGTSISTPQNNNRTSTNTCSSTVYQGTMTVTDYGTKLERHEVDGGAKLGKFILAPNTDYIIWTQNQTDYFLKSNLILRFTE